MKNLSQFLIIILFTTVLILIEGCSTALPPPRYPDNICQIFHEYPNWYVATKQSAQRWGTPISVQVAIINSESGFLANAKPKRERLLGFIPWRYPSSSYGYAQATKNTWYLYERDTHHFANPTAFYDAIDFVGWYTYSAHIEDHIALNDTYDLYLAYHDGMGNYRRKRAKQQSSTNHLARRVEILATLYSKQLLHCNFIYNNNHYYHYSKSKSKLNVLDI